MAAQLGPLTLPRPTVLQSVIGEVMIDDVLRPVMEVSSGNLYELDRILRGTIFGQVNLAVKIHRTNEGTYSRVMPLQYFAIKVYTRERLQALQGRTQENPFQEIAAMQYVGNDNENVMGQIECCSDRENIYSVMDFSDGDELFDVVDRNGPFNEETAKRLFYQLLKGTQYIHSKDLCHRDMSLENTLISRMGVIRIIDFGMALRLPRRTEPPHTIINIPPQGRCGKRNYIAPEVMVNRDPINLQLSDIWALGVKLFIMLTGVPPVDQAIATDERYQMVRAGHLGQMLTHWNISLSAEVVDLMTNILRERPSDRLTVEQMLNHPWMATVAAEAEAQEQQRLQQAQAQALQQATQMSVAAATVVGVSRTVTEGEGGATETDGSVRMAGV